MLTQHSAWWGESFVTELRKVSTTLDRKVQFASRPASDTKPEDICAALPKQDESLTTKDKESDPAAAVEDNKASAAIDLPMQPKKSATQ